ncbi:MAG: hypothetical protein Q7S59_04425, partial [Sulfurimonas sp.]|nr:hypothetical protein [Sulfurimonas sp.]
MGLYFNEVLLYGKQNNEFKTQTKKFYFKSEHVMSIFEIELNPDFYILNSDIYITKNNFERYCKNNNIEFKDDISKEYLVDSNLYPDWLLFYLYENFNKNYIVFFKYIAEARYEKYEKNIYKDNNKYTKDELYSFMYFLYIFHQELKDREKYKLMWNLEVYMLETMSLLISKNVLIDDIYRKVGNGCATHSALQEVYVYQKLYIKESIQY